MASLDVESNYFVRSFWQIVCSCCIKRCCLLVGWKIPALTNCGCASHCFEHFLLVPRWVSIHVGTGASRWSPVLQGKLLGLRGWRLPNRTWNQWTFPSMSQLTWLSIVHSIDWCLRLALRTYSMPEMNESMRTGRVRMHFSWGGRSHCLQLYAVTSFYIYELTSLSCRKTIVLIDVLKVFYWLVAQVIVVSNSVVIYATDFTDIMIISCATKILILIWCQCATFVFIAWRYKFSFTFH